MQKANLPEHHSIVKKASICKAINKKGGHVSKEKSVSATVGDEPTTVYSLTRKPNQEEFYTINSPTKREKTKTALFPKVIELMGSQVKHF